MRIRLTHHIALALAVLFVIGLCFSDADAQQRRRRRTSRRITNPVVTSRTPQPGTTTNTTNTTTTTDPQIISTADDPANSQGGDQTGSRRNRRSRTVATESDQEAMRRTVDKLSTQVTQLTDKIGQMEQQQRTLVDLERLSRAEARAEAFRKQLIEVQEKEANLQAQMDKIDSDLRPENIERSVATYGSTRPEDVRADRKRQLENERARIQSQLALLTTSRVRLEAAVASSDLEVDTLRARLDATATTTAAPNATTSVETGTTPTPQPTTPTPGASTNTDGSPTGTP